MFQIAHEPIQAQCCQAGMTHAAAGGYVSFEGWVRNHNEGKTVVSLAYEAYEALAHAEGLKILEEAKGLFEIIDAHCVHRVGVLNIGDMAVWVGVTAAHRKAAFEACEYVINQIKHRLPIWKKETYADGDSGWVNCQHCSDAAHAAETHSGLALAENFAAPGELNEQAFYARQVQLPEVGLAGQAQLKSARVLVVGAGGLGSAALQCLAAAGIGTLGVCDFDCVEVSNLHRQMLYRVEDLGQSKVEAAARQLRQLNPFIEIQALVASCTAENALTLMEPYDWVLDCTDNFEAKYALNDAAVRAGKPLLQASIYQYEGQLSLYRPNDPDAACLRCLWPEPPNPADFPACAAAGVLGVTSSYFGTLQATQLLQHLLDLPGQLHADEVLTVSLLDLSAHRFQHRRNKSCPVCGDGNQAQPGAISASVGMMEREPFSLNLAEMQPGLQSEFIWVDLAEIPETHLTSSDANVWHVPYSRFLAETPAFDPDKKYVLVCEAGGRSLLLAKQLRRQGLPQVYSLAGGLTAFKQYYHRLRVN